MEIATNVREHHDQACGVKGRAGRYANRLPHQQTFGITTTILNQSEPKSLQFKVDFCLLYNGSYAIFFVIV